MSPDQLGPRRAALGSLLALDVDGVLLDSQRGGRGPWQDAFGERFGVDPSRLNDTLFAAPWADVIIGGRPIEAALAEALDQLGWTMGVEAALACWFEEDFVVDAAVLDAAAGWTKQGIPLALVSNQEPRRARYLEQRVAPLLAICGTAFSGDLGVVKSDPTFYGRAEVHIGLAHGAPVVFLDDTLANVQVASAHGWTGIHFTKGGDWLREVSAALDSLATESNSAGGPTTSPGSSRARGSRCPIAGAVPAATPQTEADGTTQPVPLVAPRFAVLLVTDSVGSGEGGGVVLEGALSASSAPRPAKARWRIASRIAHPSPCPWWARRATNPSRPSGRGRSARRGDPGRR